jgi:pyrimidine deaminase RibD-like protein
MMDDRDFMTLAISEARRCDHDPTGRRPSVGAVIALDGKLIAGGFRGPDTHAKKDALSHVSQSQVLSDATVYTTLEPCTGAVRSKPLEACTNLLTQAGVKKVFVGILDPNQDVCGKGVLELQKHKIEVILFDNDLAEEIRHLNAPFIRAQQSLGLQITSPRPGEELETYKTEGKHSFHCTCLTRPGGDIYVLVERNGRWWPQPGLHQVGNTDEYTFVVSFGSTGEHTIHVVRASELGSVLISYYHTVVDRNLKRRSKLKDEYPDLDYNILGGDYYGIPMTKLPRGLDSQASLTVMVKAKP